MRAHVLKILSRITWSDADRWLFLAFLIALPLSVRKVLWYLPLRGSFNEYADVSLYASDILLVATLGACILLQRHISNNMSSTRVCFTWNIIKHTRGRLLAVILPLGLIINAFISLAYSKELIIGVFFVCKLIELYGLYLFVLFRIVPCGTNHTIQTQSVFSNTILIFIALGVTESALGILQFIQQQSVGLSLIKESIVNPALPGVAKVIINNTQYIRAYGTFPHPNILGGFLLVSIIMSHLYRRVFHVKHTRLMFFGGVVLLIQYICLVLTFSKSAMIGLVIAWMYMWFVSRGTMNSPGLLKRRIALWIKKLFHVEQIGAQIVLFGIISLAISSFFIKINIDKLFFQSLREREIYQSIVLDIIHNYPILGISCGQLVIFMAQQSTYPLLLWQMQPVHNVFLLIWAELGVVGFFIFTLWYFLLIVGLRYVKKGNGDVTFGQCVPRETIQTTDARIYFRAMVFGFLPILLFDHYMWDIQQGQLIFWIVSGLMVGSILQHNKV
jgi:hypothetical protein